MFSFITKGYERAMLDLAVARTEPVVVNERGTKRKLDLTKTSEKVDTINSKDSH